MKFSLQEIVEMKIFVYSLFSFIWEDSVFIF